MRLRGNGISTSHPTFPGYESIGSPRRFLASVAAVIHRPFLDDCVPFGKAYRGPDWDETNGEGALRLRGESSRSQFEFFDHMGIGLRSALAAVMRNSQGTGVLSSRTLCSTSQLKFVVPFL